METRTIFCPICGRKVMTYDLRARNTLHVKCKDCNMMVVVNTITGNIRVENEYERTTASGARFF